MNRLEKSSVLFQWNFFERTIGNYSVIIRMLTHMGDSIDLVEYMPRVFVEETVFDTCQIVWGGGDRADQGFFSIDEKSRPIRLDDMERTWGGLLSPSVVNDSFGYGTIFLFPFQTEMEVQGYVVLAKRSSLALSKPMVTELELLCQILSKSLLLQDQMREKRAEDERRVADLDSKLGMTRRLLENVIDQFPYALLLVDRTGRVCFVNRKSKEDLEQEGVSLVGERIDRILAGIGEDFFAKDRMVQREIHYKLKDSYKLFKLESYPIKDDEGRLVWKSVVLKDVMEEKLSEEDNVNQRRTEGIGRLAGGIAHDFNNLLTGVLGYASLIKKFVTDEKQLYRYAEVIENSAKRAAVLTQHLLNFSRRQRRTLDMVDINAMLDDVLFLLKESFRDIEIEKEFDASIAPMKGDDAQLQNAFLNLCINSTDAMEAGGKLTVRTTWKKGDSGKEFVVVEIEDTGCGIGEEIKSRIFQPYFTTKLAGTKLGMGLYLVDRVVRDHGGFIEVDSEVGKGAHFAIYLPFQPKVREEQTPQAPVRAFAGTAKILVVDDEDVIRELVAGVLRKEGFEVVEASDGANALRYFESPPYPDLVVLDMVMPGIKGDEVLRQIRRISKDIKVIVSSGYMNEEQREKLKGHRVDAYLDKPYREADILAVVEKVLSSPSN